MENFNGQQQTNGNATLAFISETLNSIGIYAPLNGFYVLRSCIDMKRKHPRLKNSDIFRTVADSFGMSLNNLNSAVRYAIATAWRCGNVQHLNEIFGVHCFDERYPMPNCKFICQIADLTNLYFNK